METVENKELAMYALSSILASAKTLDDKALLIDKDIGIDTLYGLIASGETELNIAESLGINDDELKYILSRTPDLRKKLINARMFYLSSESLEVLSTHEFRRSTFLEKEQVNATSHHMSIIDKVSKILNAPTGDTGTSVTVTNTITLANSGNIPDLPDGLQDIVDAEYCEVDNGTYTTNYADDEFLNDLLED